MLNVLQTPSVYSNNRSRQKILTPLQIQRIGARIHAILLVFYYSNARAEALRMKNGFQPCHSAGLAMHPESRWRV